MNNKKIPTGFLGVFCAAFCSGIVLAAYTRVSLPAFYFYAFLAFSCAAFSLDKSFRFGIFICLLAVFLGGTFFRNSQFLCADHIAKLTPYKSREAVLRGVIISDPVIGNRRTTFILDTQEVIINRRTRASGRVQVIFFGKNDFFYGQELTLEGKLYRPMNFSLGKKLRYRDYLQQQGIYSLFSTKRVEHLRKNQANPVQALAFWLKHKIQQILRRHIRGVPLAVLEAMLLGERQGIPAYLSTAMMHTGTIHILVVSGFNVGIVAFIALLALKIMRLARRPRYFVTILIIILYCLITGASLPVVRATIMAIAILAGKLLKREANVYQSLSLSALLILFFNPSQLFNVGFQLSFASVLALIALYPKIYALFPEKLCRINMLRLLIQVFSASSSAWLGTVGLVAYYFNIFSVLGIPANMLIAPYASLITAAALSLVFIGASLPALAFLFAASAELFALILIEINLFFSHLPHAYFNIPQLNFIYVFIYYAALILFVLPQK
ncbi:MAG: ComEC/Rec2 family competence protein [Candidatus Omnitrophica bacterium]|nr:ComEC/Rec2 family competence protein [Candidatus Omnitrophota bacterium]MDD5236535.1 ComEC/Rec2 family competence protein [Candidatus Omnitrophota bacterium]MDD5610797.1 ComEC/Rec2 family competence protein [Candidatus Omnitrophota bacterium]